VLGHESGHWYPLELGFVHPIMLPDVSTISMKYGFAGGGHIFGSGDEQS
jgi:hypothetical protein